jgi:SAM-dependent methyltransferase
MYAAHGAAIRARVARWLPEDRDAPILDIGCGPGIFLALLDSLGYTRVTGVDLSGEQVALARAACPRATVLQGDAREVMARNPGHFALITGFDIVEHFGKDELFPLLETIHAALRPGGRVLLQTPNAASPWGLALRYGDLTHETCFDPRSLGHALRMSGFGEIEARECGPWVHGLKSLVRVALWQAMRAGMAAWNLVETGSTGGGVYTRVFTAAARKPAAPGA